MKQELIKFVLLYLLAIFFVIQSWLVYRRNAYTQFSYKHKIFEDDYRKIERQRHRFFMSIIFFFVEIIMIFCVLSINLVGIVNVADNRDMSVRIEEIATNLADSSSKLSYIQQELEGRVEFVENLKKEAEIAENVISLTNEQVEAVQAQLNQELDENSGESLLINILISTFFFILGLFVPSILNYFKKKSNKLTEVDGKFFDNKIYSDDQIEQAIMLLDSINQTKESQD